MTLKMIIRKINMNNFVESFHESHVKFQTIVELSLFSFVSVINQRKLYQFEKLKKYMCKLREKNLYSLMTFSQLKK